MTTKLKPRDLVILNIIIQDLEEQRKTGELAAIPPNAEKIMAAVNEYGQKTGASVEIGVLNHPSQVTMSMNRLREAGLIRMGISRTKDAIRPTNQAVQLINGLRRNGYFTTWEPGKYQPLVFER